ncbi:hypothetical protein AVEN_192108-1 [Araneus ventricosus]|uniref:Uncharacterized protein n=1 Tax=Araneus ventricosus TaxID=182803 RepID=A0A4Y2B6D9_ARAVE|nr:hypothetical protein AVEN_192108-1 [Araneus ventricosus]
MTIAGRQEVLQSTLLLTTRRTDIHLWFANRSGLIVEPQHRNRRITGPRPDSAKDTSCAWPPARRRQACCRLYDMEAWRTECRLGCVIVNQTIVVDKGPKLTGPSQTRHYVSFNAGSLFK